MKTDYYVYALCDPRKPGVYEYGEYKFEFEPFYVGKGSNDRCYWHLYECNLEENTHKNNKIKKIIREGFEIIVVKYNENLIENVSFELEIDMIKTIGRADLGIGPLTNHTDGGEGTSGYIRSEETRIKDSERMIKYNIENPGHQSGENAPNWGRKFYEEHNQKISKATKGENNPFYNQHHTEETIQNQSERMIGKYSGEKNPMYGVRLCGENNHMYGKHRTDEEKAKISKGGIGKHNDSNATRKKKSDSRKGKIPWNKGIKMGPKSPETIRKRNEARVRNKELKKLKQLEGVI